MGWWRWRWRRRGKAAELGAFVVTEPSPIPLSLLSPLQKIPPPVRFRYIAVVGGRALYTGGPLCHASRLRVPVRSGPVDATDGARHVVCLTAGADKVVRSGGKARWPTRLV